MVRTASRLHYYHHAVLESIDAEGAPKPCRATVATTKGREYPNDVEPGTQMVSVVWDRRDTRFIAGEHEDGWFDTKFFRIYKKPAAPNPESPMHEDRQLKILAGVYGRVFISEDASGGVNIRLANEEGDIHDYSPTHTWTKDELSAVLKALKGALQVLESRSPSEREWQKIQKIRDSVNNR